MLYILCGIIRDVIDENVHVTASIDWAIRHFRKQLPSVVAAKGAHIEQHFDQCFSYCRYVIEIFSMCVVVVGNKINEMVYVFMHHPVHSRLCK